MVAPYCPWLCPFGAAQDVVGRLTGAAAHRAPSALLFTWVKRVLLWLAVLLGLAFGSPGAASHEIFGTAFRGSGSGFQIAILVLVVAASLVVARPYCHWLCLVNVPERLLRALRRRLLRLPGGDLLAAALVVAHLATRFAAMGGEAERGRMSETFVAAPHAR